MVRSCTQIANAFEPFSILVNNGDIHKQRQFNRMATSLASSFVHFVRNSFLDYPRCFMNVQQIFALWRSGKPSNKWTLEMSLSCFLFTFSISFHLSMELDLLNGWINFGINSGSSSSRIFYSTSLGLPIYFFVAISWFLTVLLIWVFIVYIFLSWQYFLTDFFSIKRFYCLTDCYLLYCKITLFCMLRQYGTINYGFENIPQNFGVLSSHFNFFE